MNIFFTDYFKGQLKRLKKKYPHVKDDLLEKVRNLKLQDEIHIGKSVYKIRIKCSDSEKGKSGGFRTYLYLYKKKDLIVPLCMYSKSQKESLTKNELHHHFLMTIRELISDFR